VLNPKLWVWSVVWRQLACPSWYHIKVLAFSRIRSLTYCTTTVMVVLCETVPEVAVRVKACEPLATP